MLPIKKASLELDIQRSGWANLSIKMLFNEEYQDLYSEGYNELENSFVMQGYEIAPYSENNEAGLVASMPINLASIQELQGIFRNGIFGDLLSEIIEPPLIIEKGITSTRYKFKTTVYSLDITEQDFKLKMPGTIINHNADKIEDNMLVWDLSTTRQVVAESQAINSLAIIIIIIISLGALALVIILLYRAGRPSYKKANISKVNISMFCSYCGSKITYGSQYCSKCGRRQ